MSKLTKMQKEFFSNFANTAVANLLGPVLDYKGVEISEEGLLAAISTVDLSELTQAIGEEYLKHADFKTIKKVDAFMRSEEFQTVVKASADVQAAINDLVISIVTPLIPQDVPATAV